MNKQLQYYLKKGYKNIEGWYSKIALEIIAELSKIQNSNNIKGSLCEIGVHHGRCFVLLSLLSQTDEICLAIDLFEEQNQNLDNSGCGDKEIVVNNLKLQKCDLNRVKFITSNSVNLQKGNLLDLSSQKYRFFSLDGGHSIEIIQNDLSLAESVLVDGGIILVDDYFDEKWPGVSEGTLKYILLNKSNLIPFAIFDDKVLFTNDVIIKSKYIKELKNLVPRYIIKETHFLNQFCLIIYSSPNKYINKIRKTKIWQSIKVSNLGNKIRSVLK